MEQYTLTIADGLTIIQQLHGSFKMSVHKNRVVDSSAATAIIEGTLYREEGVFVQSCTYIFEALGDDNKPLTDGVNVDDFKRAVDFFFTRVLQTDLYLKGIPRTSGLCNNEMRMFAFNR
jgi:hypothetical protein